MNRKQRRAQQKRRKTENKTMKAANKSAVPYSDYIWRNDKKKDLSPPEKKVPGINCPPQDPHFTSMCDSNLWHDRQFIDEFVAKIKKLSDENDPNNDWSWAYNSNCKYVNLRFDMRDGGFIFTNDKGQRINLEQLEWQYRSLTEEENK